MSIYLLLLCVCIFRTVTTKLFAYLKERREVKLDYRAQKCESFIVMLIITPVVYSVGYIY